MNIRIIPLVITFIINFLYCLLDRDQFRLRQIYYSLNKLRQFPLFEFRQLHICLLISLEMKGRRSQHYQKKPILNFRKKKSIVNYYLTIRQCLLSLFLHVDFRDVLFLQLTLLDMHLLLIKEV